MKFLSLPFLVLFLVFLLSCEKVVTIEKEEAHWDYENPDWQQIGYISCGGNAQSPVDINTTSTLVVDQLPALEMDYRPFAMKIVDNGHTIQVNPPQPDNAIVFNQVRYTFVQFHFHHHSEHQINGQYHPLELHCVHRDQAGNLLVLTFMIDIGDPHPFFDWVFDNIPSVQNMEISTNIQLNISDILPNHQGYFTYYGSLTTPPCSATVQFIILKEHITASSQQVSKFASIYDDNYRVIQPLNNRIILEKP